MIADTTPEGGGRKIVVEKSTVPVRECWRNGECCKLYMSSMKKNYKSSKSVNLAR